MREIRIAVLGSVVADLIFRMPRLPGRGETLFADDVALHPGGKGLNQAIAAKRLGASDVALIGRVGSDPFATFLLETLKREGIGAEFVAMDEAAGTGIAVPVVFPDGSNSIFSAPRASLRITDADVAAAGPAIARADALLLQFEAPMEANLVAARIARGAGVRVVLNPAPVREFPPELLELADVLVVNEVEAAMLGGGGLPPEEQAVTLLRHGAELAVVTLGERGAVFATADGAVAQPAFPVRALDSVGAGDAFCGALTVALVEGQAAGDAVRSACAAGALSVTRAGAAASLPTRAEVERLLGGESS
ncbi:MAG: ribokinase [Chloroflexi bacterium]|nr:ribokinase [Chloroflexota bacterium]